MDVEWLERTCSQGSHSLFPPATNPSTASTISRALQMFVAITKISTWHKLHVEKKKAL